MDREKPQLLTCADNVWQANIFTSWSFDSLATCVVARALQVQDLLCNVCQAPATDLQLIVSVLDQRLQRVAGMRTLVQVVDFSPAMRGIIHTTVCARQFTDENATHLSLRPLTTQFTARLLTGKPGPSIRRWRPRRCVAGGESFNLSRTVTPLIRPRLLSKLRWKSLEEIPGVRLHNSIRDFGCRSGLGREDTRSPSGWWPLNFSFRYANLSGRCESPPSSPLTLSKLLPANVGHHNRSSSVPGSREETSQSESVGKDDCPLL